MKRKEYMKMLKSKKKKATRREELREFKTFTPPYGDDYGCEMWGYRNIAINKNVITSVKYYDKNGLVIKEKYFK